MNHMIAIVCQYYEMRRKQYIEQWEATTKENSMEEEEKRLCYLEG